MSKSRLIYLIQNNKCVHENIKLFLCNILFSVYFCSVLTFFFSNWLKLSINFAVGKEFYCSRYQMKDKIVKAKNKKLNLKLFYNWVCWFYTWTQSLLQFKKTKVVEEKWNDSQPNTKQWQDNYFLQLWTNTWCIIWFYVKEISINRDSKAVKNDHETLQTKINFIYIFI